MLEGFGFYPIGEGGYRVILSRGVQNIPHIGDWMDCDSFTEAWKRVFGKVKRRREQ